LFDFTTREKSEVGHFSTEGYQFEPEYDSDKIPSTDFIDLLIHISYQMEII
jgi:hypothetical protein